MREIPLHNEAGLDADRITAIHAAVQSLSCTDQMSDDTELVEPPNRFKGGPIQTLIIHELGPPLNIVGAHRKVLLRKRERRKAIGEKLKECFPDTWRVRLFHARAAALLMMAETDRSLDPKPDSWYTYWTQKGGDVARQLAFAGIATCWIFHGADGALTEVPFAMLPALLAFPTALAFDLLHYVSGAIIEDMRGTPSDRFGLWQETRNWIILRTYQVQLSRVFYMVKMCMLVFGYISLVRFLLNYSGLTVT